MGKEDDELSDRVLRKLNGYGSLKSSYGCCSLRFGVFNWSLFSLLFGIGLLLFAALVRWTIKDLVHFTFEVEKDVVATFRLGKGAVEKKVENMESPLSSSSSFTQLNEGYMQSSSQLEASQIKTLNINAKGRSSNNYIIV